MPSITTVIDDTNTITKTDTKDVSSKDYLIHTSKEPNYKGWLLANMLINTSGSTVDQFMPLYANFLGATNTEIGLLTGLYALINVSQLIWAKLSTALARMRIFVIIGWLIQALLFIPIAFLKHGQVLVLIILRFFQGFFSSATAPTYASLQADHILEKDRATRLSQFARLALVGSLIGTLAGGMLFNYLLDILNLGLVSSYTIVFIWTCLLGIMAALVFSLSVPDYQRINTIDSEILVMRELYASTDSSKLSLKQQITIYITKFRNFWHFVVFAMIFWFGVYIAGPFFIIVEIEYYNFSFFEAGLLSAFSIIVQIFIVIYLEHSKILDRLGRKIMLYPAIFLAALTSIATIIPMYLPIHAFSWCIIIWIVSGFGWGVLNAVLTILLLDIVHPKYRTTLIAIFNTIIGLIMFLGPVIGGILTDLFANIIFVFILRFLFMVLSMIFLFKVTEPTIPGTLVRPVRYVFPRVLRHTSLRGVEVVLAVGSSKNVKTKHIGSSQRFFKFRK